MTGAAIKAVLEDVCDNLFHPDPYYQQGGDMVRVGAMTYGCRPGAKIGRRIDDMRLRGRPIEADKLYKVAGGRRSSKAPRAKTQVSRCGRCEPLSSRQEVVKPRKLNLPRLVGVSGNLGIA